MAERASWNGYLKLSLVSCSVSLFPATTQADRTRFHVVNRKTGNRVKRVFIDAETEKVVDTDEQVKGFEVGKGDYIYVEDDEIDDIRIESTHTIDIERFVPRDDVNSRFLDRPYYVAPDDKVAQEAFAVIREAMAKEKKAGIGRIVMARREHMVLLEPLDRGILATTLRYPYEMRAEERYFDDIPKTKISPEMLELAAHIIDKKSGPFEPDAFEDRYEKALVALVKSKQTGKPPPTPKDVPKPSNVINLMDALKKSISAEKSGGRTAARAQTRTTAKRTTRRRAARTGAKRRAAG
ncbi:MAG: Ku protein [Alphaproteobacteria bacterium]|nr:Ku protein [Alphaproteobacteria bacterium]